MASTIESNPRSDTLMLVALPSAVWIGRAHTAAVLRGWGHRAAAFIEDAQLIASELITNSIQALGYADNPPATRTLLAKDSLIRITLSELDDSLSINVWDSHPRLPEAPAEVPFEAESGRGLFIVRSIAKEAGYRYSDGVSGKTVFATLPFPRVFANE
ncbi:ATP-binding protein [Spongiactinospora rosea]|nr:ATP-binding protein [Spongiactinospora rosea]